MSVHGASIVFLLLTIKIELYLWLFCTYLQVWFFSYCHLIPYNEWIKYAWKLSSSKQKVVVIGHALMEYSGRNAKQQYSHITWHEYSNLPNHIPVLSRLIKLHSSAENFTYKLSKISRNSNDGDDSREYGKAQFGKWLIIYVNCALSKGQISHASLL